MNQQATDKELETLSYMYNFSDQYGVVNMNLARKIIKEQLGIFLPDRPVTLTQKHIDMLMDAGAVPDTRAMFNTLFRDKKKRPLLS